MNLFDRYAGVPTVSVEIAGVKHQVPQGITVLQAFWFLGMDVVKGAGCLGGACGACTTTYRMPDMPGSRTALGCQTVVRDGMSFTLYPLDPPVKPVYRMEAIEDPAEGLLRIYPEVRRCTACDACTTACPQGIGVRTAVKQALNRDFDAVAPAFDDCVMCGFCAVVCEVNIAPNLVGLYARKAVARSLPPPPELVRRMTEVREGVYGAGFSELLALSGRALAERCDALWAAAVARN